MTRSRILRIALIALIAAFAVHLAFSTLPGIRADLTEDHIYSLSPGTLRILDRMREEGVEPIEIKLYFSETTGKTLPRFIKDFINYERYLRSLLHEYQRAGGGKLRVSFIDPLTDSDDAENATRDGLESRPVNEHGDLFFFGLTMETQTGSKQAIPFLWPNEQESIEYEISRRLYSLLWPSSKRIGVVSSLDVFGGADNPYLARMLAAQGRQAPEKWIALQLLEESYELSPIDLQTDHIDHASYDLVIVVHPKSLPGGMLWALDEWVVTGGRLLVFLDPYSITDQAPQDPQQPWAALQYEPASNLEPLLGAWGLRSPLRTFAADFDLAVKRPMVRNGPVETVVVDLQIDADDTGKTLGQSPVMQGIESLRLLLAGSLETIDAAAEGGEAANRGFEITPLLTTTPEGSTLKIEPGFGGQEGLFYTDLNNAAKIRDAFHAGEKPVVLGYQVSGRLPSAYPAGADFQSGPAPQPPPGLPPGVDLPTPEGSERVHEDPVAEDLRADSTVIVFADVDLIADQIAFQRNILGLVVTPNDNHKLLLNSVDHLLGAPELMSVRARNRIDRPFVLFDEIEEDAERATLEREREIREEIEGFQQQLREKQSEITQRNAALFQRKLQQEVDALNLRIQEKNGELREIRKGRREAIESEESRVRFAVMGWMPTLVLILGLIIFARRRRPAAK